MQIPEHLEREMIKHYSEGEMLYLQSGMLDKEARAYNIIAELRKFLKPGDKVLDVGCGDMTLSKLAPEFSWIGIDIDTREDPRIIKQDVTKTPYRIDEGSCNAVVCSEVLEHLWAPEDVVAEMYRVAAKNAVVIVTTPNFRCIENVLSFGSNLLYGSANGWTKEHIRLFSYENLKHMFEQAGITYLSHRGHGGCFSAVTTQYMRNLHRCLKDKYKLDLSQSETDAVLGEIMPELLPGIMVVGRKYK